MYYLGIDAGTSGLKALLIDEHAAIVGRGAVRYDLRYPRPGWAESDPEEWWTALCRATRQALAAANISGARVAGIGLSGQMHTLVLLDDSGCPVRPAISWADARGAQERAEIERRVGRARLIALTGSPAVTAFTATKLLWVRRHEPRTWARARVALLAKDYLRRRLTGALATDPTDAGATGLLDLRARDWSDEVLEALELPRALLPPIAPSAAPAGAVTAEAAAATGLRAGTPVATGAGDQECAALGCGVTDPGPLLITVGTGGQLFAATATPLTDSLGRLHALPHALPGRWHLLAAIPAAGLALDWVSALLGGMDNGGQHSLAAASRHGAYWSRASGDPPLFVPSLAGERTPSMDDAARGAFFGLSLAHTRDDLLFAAHEGVAFALRACLEVLGELGMPLDNIAVTGGLSGDPAFLALLSNALGRPLAPAAQRDGSGYGAALLGGLAVGALALPRGVPLAGGPIAPAPERAVWHERRYAVYRRLSPALMAACSNLRRISTVASGAKPAVDDGTGGDDGANAT